MRLLAFLLLVSIAAVHTCAQSTATVDPNIVLKVSIANNQREFRIGETIPLQLSFSSTVKNQYQVNMGRLHSALGYQPPEEFEQLLESTAINAGATMSFFRHGEDYRPDGAAAKTKSGPQTAPLTIDFDESPAGYSLASCSPAELASASPADADSATTELV